MPTWTSVEREALELLRNNEPGAIDRLMLLDEDARVRILSALVETASDSGSGGDVDGGSDPSAQDRNLPAGSSPPQSEAASRTPSPTDVRSKSGVGLRRAAVALLFAGCLAGGAAGGWWLRDSRGDVVAPLEIATEIERPVVVVPPANVTFGTMPNLLGLPLEQARRTLFDSGMTADGIVVSQHPTALQPGLVVLQDPAAGAPLADRVILIESIQAQVPDLAGLHVEEARRVLSELGANATVRRESDPTLAPGTVLHTDPPPGKVLERSIILTVATS